MPQFDTPRPISVMLELRVGDVRVAAAPRADTTVQVRPSDPSSRDDVTAAEQTRVEYADGRLLVKQPRRLRELSPFGDGGCIDVDVELPAGSDVSGQAAAGEFRCLGSLGRCELKSGVGAIAVDRAARVKLTTAGDISLERATGDAELTTSTGDVRAGAIDGAAQIKNSNGDTWIGEAGGEIRVKAANGDIDVSHARGAVSAKTANGHVRVGSIHRGVLVGETGNGHVEVGIPSGVAAWLDLDTGYGHVDNDLDAAEAPGPADERVEVRARTGLGNITIRRREAEPTGEPMSGATGRG